MYMYTYGHLPLVLYAQPWGDCKTSDVRRPYGVILRCGHARRCGWKPNDIRLLWLVSLGCLVGVSGPGPSWARPGCCLCPFCCCLFALCLSLRCLSFYSPFLRLRGTGSGRIEGPRRKDRFIYNTVFCICLEPLGVQIDIIFVSFNLEC